MSLPTLRARRLGIDTQHELCVYLRDDCEICRSEGYTALSRITVALNGRNIIATLYIVHGDLLSPGQIGLSESAWQRLQPEAEQLLTLSHPKQVESLSAMRAKVYGHHLTQNQLQQIINDIVADRYTDVQVAAFITACANNRLSIQEIISLTRAMIRVGSQLNWNQPVVVDKHCVGGLPGNRTTPIVVSILAACGLTVPKTSSRAITSPAGTADTMETMTNVDLSLNQMREVVQQQGGCLAWGGTVKLSPADDLLIQVERSLDIDSEGQLIASVLSKKMAAGATHVVIDIPVGPTAKVRNRRAADQLARNFRTVASALGLELEILFTDGRQPVGRGIGPALEARDLLAVLRQQPDAPQDLQKRALDVAGRMLEMIGHSTCGQGYAKAEEILQQGLAWQKFHQICEAQGGFQEPPVATFTYTLQAKKAGVISNIHNRQLSKAAKLAGAPADLCAGLDLHITIGNCINPGDPLLTLHAASEGELHYALDYLNTHPDTIIIDDELAENES